MSTIAALQDAWRNRDKLGDGSQSKELAAFLPAALEIQETPPNPLYRWLSLSLVVLFLLAIIWACVGKVNIVASAEGKIIPSARVKHIQPLEKGVVSAILVNEGDRVIQGQPLLELDSTITTADRNRLVSELHSTRMRHLVNITLLEIIERSSQQLEQLTFESLRFPAAEDIAEQDLLLHRRMLWQKWQEYRSKQESLNSALDRVRAEQGVTREVIAKLEQTLPIVTRRSETLLGLYEKSYVSENEFMLAEQERINQVQDLAAERYRYRQLQASESEVHEQINTLSALTSGDLLAEISDQQRTIAALEEELIKATGVNARQVISAPVTGRVQDLAITTVGGVVTEAQLLMLIVPEEDALEVEVFVENKDIGFVRSGMSAEIKVHTFPFTKYGVINAEVINLASDAIVDEQRGLIYRMLLRMDRNNMHVDGSDVILQPGMSVTAELKTGDRRVIEFFLAPLLKGTAESIRER